MNSVHKFIVFVFLFASLLTANCWPFRELRDTGLTDDPAEQNIPTSDKTSEKDDLTLFMNVTGGKNTTLLNTTISTLNVSRIQTTNWLSPNKTRNATLIEPSKTITVSSSQGITTRNETTTLLKNMTRTITLQTNMSSKYLNQSTSSPSVQMKPTPTKNINASQVTSRPSSTIQQSAMLPTQVPINQSMSGGNKTGVIPATNATSEQTTNLSTTVTSPTSNMTSPPSSDVTQQPSSNTTQPANNTEQSPSTNGTSQPITNATQQPTTSVSQQPTTNVSTLPATKQTTAQSSSLPPSEQPSTEPTTTNIPTSTTSDATTKKKTNQVPTTKQLTTQETTSKETQTTSKETETTSTATTPPTTTKLPTKKATEEANTKAPTKEVSTGTKTTDEATTTSTKPEQEPTKPETPTEKNDVQNDIVAMAPPKQGNEAVLWDFIIPVGIGASIALAVAFGVLLIRTCRRKRLVKVRFGKPSHPRLLNNDLINLLAESDDEEE